MVPSPTQTDLGCRIREVLGAEPRSRAGPPRRHPVTVHDGFNHAGLDIIEDEYPVVVGQLFLQVARIAGYPLDPGHVYFSAYPAGHGMHIAVMSGMYAYLCGKFCLIFAVHLPAGLHLVHYFFIVMP